MFDLFQHFKILTNDFVKTFQQNFKLFCMKDLVEYIIMSMPICHTSVHKAVILLYEHTTTFEKSISYI